MQHKPTDLITLGKITSVYGVRGWVKIFSHTDPMDQILDYERWFIERDGERRWVNVDRGKSHGKGMIAHIQGVDDRAGAEALAGFEIKIERSMLPKLDDGDYYWWQLEGLAVETVDGVALGRVHHMMSAGRANDVMVVQSERPDDSQQERLIPYLWEQVVKSVDLDRGMITVDWDPEF
ncbi:ribosome maturation factor RimM [Salinispirillum marinum]|uniref:Ribosome maturation factor RimM n=2 Tax=Saccharospirillaceae TaxID=255527 RepID=A0ABV8BFY4_9GAMM